MTTCRHVSCRVLAPCDAMHQNTEAELNSFRDFQPVKVTEKWIRVLSALRRIPTEHQQCSTLMLKVVGSITIVIVIEL